MKNLLPFDSSCIDFYREAVSRKKDLVTRQKLQAIEASINTEFDIYERHFRARTLERISPNGLFTGNKTDLLSLYNYQSFIIKKLRQRISDLQVITVRNTCQNCTLIPIQSMDHILPKEHFPEFSVNPLNLFPSCQTCNGHKSASTAAGGKKIFLNLFLDDLPTDQYLFVTIKKGKDGLDFEFRVKPPKKIGAELSELIESHIRACT